MPTTRMTSAAAVSSPTMTRSRLKPAAPATGRGPGCSARRRRPAPSSPRSPQPRRPRRAVGAHRERGGGVRVGGPQRAPDDRHRQRAPRRPAADAGRARDRRARRRPRSRPPRRSRRAPRDSGRARAGAAPRPATARRAPARRRPRRRRTGPVEQRRRAVDRPALDEPAGVERAARPRVEVAAGRDAQPLAARQHGAHVRVRVARRQLAAVDPADLAVVAEGLKRASTSRSHAKTRSLPRRAPHRRPGSP